jgi:hypothetical protein
MAKEMPLLSRNLLQSSTLWSVLIASPASALGAPAEIYMGVDSRYSDNVEKAAVQEQEDLENRVLLRGNVQTDPGKCVASADGEIVYSIYAEKTYDPETQVNAGVFGSCELARGFSWEVENQIREVTRSSRLSDTPDNRTRKNVFSTGPGYRWRLSSQDSIQLSLRYENTKFSDPDDADSKRVTGSIAWSHAFAPDLSAGLSSSVSQVKLDTGTEIQNLTVNVTFNKRWAKAAVSGSLGVSEIETTSGPLRQKTDGYVGDLNLTRALDSNANAYLRASRELTDQTSDFDIRFDEFTFELTDSNTVEVTIAETGLNKPFSNGDVLRLSASASRTDYLDSNEQEDRARFRTGYTRMLAPQLSAVANARYDYLTFESDQSDDQIVGLDIGLSYRASSRLELVARIGRNERSSDIQSQEYEENWLLLSIDYRLR